MRLLSISLMFIVTGCSFKFALTSQRTALENQILGTYKELDAVDDPLLTVKYNDRFRKKYSGADKSKVNFELAELSRQFNASDIEILKSKQIVGESFLGKLSLLPGGQGLVSEASPEDLRLAEAVIIEENRDRQLILMRKLELDLDLTEDDLGELRNELMQKIIKNTAVGQWLQNEDGDWYQKQAEKL